MEGYFVSEGDAYPVNQFFVPEGLAVIEKKDQKEVILDLESLYEMGTDLFSSRSFYRDVDKGTIITVYLHDGIVKDCRRHYDDDNKGLNAIINAYMIYRMVKSNIKHAH